MFRQGSAIFRESTNTKKHYSNTTSSINRDFDLATRSINKLRPTKYFLSCARKLYLPTDKHKFTCEIIRTGQIG